VRRGAMKKFVILAFCVARLALTECTTASASEWTDPWDQLKSGLPLEVETYIDRRALCRRWFGSAAAERSSTVKSALVELKCEALEREEQRLRSKYAKSPNVVKALDEASDLIFR